MAFRLQVRNYRGLRAVDWSPEGVCALVGANGSGKTTLLDVPALLGDAIRKGLGRALEEHGGVAHARNLYSSAEDSYGFEVSLSGVSWSVSPFLSETGFRPAETIKIDNEVVASREAGADSAKILGMVHPVGDRLAFDVALDQNGPQLLGELLSRYHIYGSYDLVGLRRTGSTDSTDRRLDRRGTNVFSVLRNWRDKRGDRHRFDFVLAGLREIFADFFDDLEFEKAAQVVGANLILKGNRSHSASLAPDGWFVALLHLAAIASTRTDDVIAIDEPENALHPHAIKLLLEHMRTWSANHRVTVLLATHSPVIINDFDNRPQQLFVMQPDRPTSPVSVVELKDRDWLAHFALGDLYMREEFGAPQEDAEHRADHDR